jgi:hypothetical protein
MNERAGMNAIELDKYMKNSILPLYPDIEDKPGKRVLLKVDSGPGCLNVEMLADLRLQGLYLVPGVPNTTHVTQETDQNYGLYKSRVRENLRNLSQCRYDRKETLKVCDLPLIVFGGLCPSTGLLLRDAFSDAFSIERNLACWRKCGAVPLTMAPLLHAAAGVRHEIPAGAAAALSAGEEEDAAITKLKDLETSNRFFCDLLTANGLDGQQLRKDAPTRALFVAVTEPHSRERVLQLVDAKTAGQMFLATGGRHLNSDEFFKANALRQRSDKIAAMEKKKKSSAKRLVIENKVMALLESKGSLVPQNASHFTVENLKLLIKWKRVLLPASAKKAELLAAYFAHPLPPPSQDWSPEEEMELVALQSETIDMKDTAIGVATNQMARAVVQNLANIDPEMLAQLKEAVDQMDTTIPVNVI